MHKCASVCGGGGQDNLWQPILFFHHVGPICLSQQYCFMCRCSIRMYVGVYKMGWHFPISLLNSSYLPQGERTVASEE